MNTPMVGLTPEHFMAVFEQSPVPITIFDHTGLQVATNTASMTLFGVRPEDTVGRFNMLTDPQLAATGSVENHRRVMQGETVVLPPHSYNAREYQNLDDVGEERWVEAVYSPLRDPSGTVTHLVAMLRDVTNEIVQRKAIVAAQAEIASQRVLIESLSTPVVQVWEGILAMPLVGTIDSGRAM
ncbi:MAG: PAS domain-containing protein, partial [Chloroflexi bacterium]|nr:PAS domain-containing protein [Chloroflexota bacterium]